MEDVTLETSNKHEQSARKAEDPRVITILSLFTLIQGYKIIDNICKEESLVTKILGLQYKFNALESHIWIDLNKVDDIVNK